MADLVHRASGFELGTSDMLDKIDRVKRSIRIPSISFSKIFESIRLACTPIDEAVDYSMANALLPWDKKIHSRR